jgi:hypothetical protein
MCDTCKQLVSLFGGAKHCSFTQCPMKGAITIENVFEEFGKVVFAFPKPKPAAPKK